MLLHVLKISFCLLFSIDGKNGFGFLPSFDKVAHRFFLHSRSDVGVNIHGRIDVAVTESFLNNFWISAIFHEHGCVTVA